MVHCFKKTQVNRPMQTDPVRARSADSVSQAENASSTLVTRSTFARFRRSAVSSLGAHRQMRMAHAVRHDGPTQSVPSCPQPT